MPLPQERAAVISAVWRAAYQAKERRPPTPLELEPYAAAVALCPRWTWASLGRTEVESRLHYIARLTAVASAAPPSTYSCGVRSCEACKRSGLLPVAAARSRQPGEDG